MKKIYILCTLMATAIVIKAQTSLYTVTSGTNIYIKSGTIFTAGGLVIVPSSNFILTGLRLDTNATVNRLSANFNIANVYHFSTTTSPFVGSMWFYYNDSQLRGLSESTLQTQIDDGTKWNQFATTSSSSSSNYVQSSITSTALNEITLANQFYPLALEWVNVYAYRQAKQVKIEWEISQEQNIDHYTVERSEDGSNWVTAIDNIAAVNLVNEHSYSAIDNTYSPSRLYYRIKQIDFDGHSSYSSIAIVDAIHDDNALLVYPNPARNTFHIINNFTSPIKNIYLYNSAGETIKIWNAPQPSYNVQNIITGIYYLSVKLNDGTTKQFILNKL